jgi:hypothetical protein
MNDQTTFTRRPGAAYAGYRPEQQNEARPLWANHPLAAQLSSSPIRQLFVGGLLIIALFSFELFNFDTTKYALENLLGDVRFLGVGWAAILAIAFCGIDFAGLAYLFMPERFHPQARETWYLLGAWLLGATMNAIMTWWAISLTILQTQAGNELISHQQMLHVAPIFVAVLVWLTRILFISAFSVAGSHLLYQRQDTAVIPANNANASQLTAATATRLPRPLAELPLPQMSGDLPNFLREHEPIRMTASARETGPPLPERQPVRQRPTNAPDSYGRLRQRTAHMRADGRRAAA